MSLSLSLCPLGLWVFLFLFLFFSSTFVSTYSKFTHLPDFIEGSRVGCPRVNCRPTGLGSCARVSLRSLRPEDPRPRSSLVMCTGDMFRTVVTVVTRELCSFQHGDPLGEGSVDSEGQFASPGQSVKTSNVAARTPWDGRLPYVHTRPT